MPATRAVSSVEVGTARFDAGMAGANLAESLKLFEPLFCNAPFGLGFVDREFRVVRVNQRLAAVSGSTIAGQLGRTVSTIVPSLWPVLEPLYRQVLDSGKAVLDIEADGCLTTDGLAACRWSTSYYPVVVDGNVIGVGVVAVDITQRTGAERAVRFQADLLAAVGQAIVATDPAGTVVYWNPAAEGMYGWSAAEAVGRNVGDVISTAETVERGVLIFEALLRGESWSGDYWVKHRNGTVFPVYVTESPVLGRDGRLVAIIAVSVDITERRAAEELGRQLSAIVDGSGDAIFGAANDGLVTSWNAAAQRLFGYTADEIVGHSIAVLTPSDQAAAQAQVRTRVTAGGKAERFETIRRRQDGSDVEVLMTVSPVTDDALGVSGLSVIVHDITDRRRAQRRQEATLRQLAEAQRVARFGSAEFDLVTGEITRSDEYYRIMGLDPLLNPRSEELTKLVHPDDRDTVAQGWADVMNRGIALDTVCRIIRPDGQQRWVRLRAVDHFDNDGKAVGVTATLLDETERIEAERVQRSAESRFEVGFEHAGVGAVIADLDGIPTRVNAAVVAMLGRSEDLLVGRRWTEYGLPGELSLGQEALARVAAGHDTYEDERHYLRPDGTVVCVSSHVSLVRDESGQPEYFFGRLQDVTERKTMEQALIHEALHDQLTGLPNRALLTDRLQHQLSGVRQPGTHLAVMFVNIDYFKQINESLGHTAGDVVLRHVADRITDAIPPGDTVARFGGDEFVVVCDNVSVPEAEQIADRVLKALHQPCLIAACGTTVNASIGVALADENATPESMLRECGAAMYRAKERGRARVELFDETLRAKAERRFATVAALQQALEHNEFTVHYQPVVDLSTGAMVSAEALVRWEHPVRGLVPPGEFIPLAEETGLIVPLGAWILEQACQQVVQWQRTNPSMTVAVNLSVRQLLTPGIAGVVQDVLRRTNAAPASLCLELTESGFMEDVDYFATTLTGLKALGVQLSIDDFGTGYSALSYLKQFPVDAVKIDRAFVNGLGSDNHDTALVAAIIAMAAALDLEVTAEGIETCDQLAHLKALKCQRAQGYYLARPMPAAAINQLVADSHHWQVD